MADHKKRFADMKTTAKEFDELFGSGADISEFVDYSKATRPNLAQKKVDLDLPVWMIEKLDKEEI